jgi:D-alanyl-D-alanine carboxypeptidase (penicillin-binding protein 5/6)
LVVLAAIGYVIFTLVRPLPVALVQVPTSSVVHGPRLALAWPAQGTAAVGVRDVGLIGSHGSGRPAPIASVAKVMTAYVVLHDHPLGAHSSGPPITVGPADIATFQADKAAGQSVVLVRNGERLSERQALEGLLLPSGNNIATMLARWDAGNANAFVAKMNAQARALGLAHTHYADVSGVRAGTVSTAPDQVRLAMAAIGIPAFARIVAMPRATLPVAGVRDNLNGLLGRDGIVGVKTGSTAVAGGCFVFAARQRVAGRTVTVVGAVLHQPGTGGQSSIESAFQASTTLLTSVNHALRPVRVVRRGETLAQLKAPWADPVAARAARSASIVGWPGLPIHTTIPTARGISAPVAAGQAVGIAVVAAGAQRARAPLVSSREVPSASIVWRVTHP